MKPRPKPTPISERFWKYVQIGAPDACWPWRGANFNRKGYGLVHTQQAGATEPGDGILAQLLYDSAMRRHELRED